MRASEKNIRDANQSHAWGFVEDAARKMQDPDVVERFERPPYWPVLNFERGEVKRERTTESEEV